MRILSLSPEQKSVELSITLHKVCTYIRAYNPLQEQGQHSRIAISEPYPSVLWQHSADYHHPPQARRPLYMLYTYLPAERTTSQFKPRGAGPSGRSIVTRP